MIGRGFAAGFILITAAMFIPLPAISQVPDYDYGDAPEGSPAYPWLGVAGQFPTCEGGIATKVRHQVIPGFPNLFYFGNGWDAEVDGNAGTCIQPPYEMDECYYPADGEGGLTTPDGFTIVNDFPVSCGAINPRPLGQICTMGSWGSNLDIYVNNDKMDHVYVNVYVDWDQNGMWDIGSFCGSTPVPERILENLPLPAQFHGLVSASTPNPPQFLIGPNSGYVWVRFTVSPEPIASGDDTWDGSGPPGPGLDYTWENGETEDYLLRVDEADGFGACCFDDGSCQITYSQQQCDELGGTNWTIGVLCQPNPCPPTPVRTTTWGSLKSIYR
jgi:hypothetical protein